MFKVSICGFSPIWDSKTVIKSFLFFRYYECKNGELEVKDCGRDHWDNVNQWCTLPKFAGCELSNVEPTTETISNSPDLSTARTTEVKTETPKTTTIEITTPTTTRSTTTEQTTTTERISTTTEAPFNPCANTLNGRIPHPDFCYKYYECISGIPYIHICADDEIYSQRARECVYGDHITCT